MGRRTDKRSEKYVSSDYDRIWIQEPPEVDPEVSLYDKRLDLIAEKIRQEVRDDELRDELEEHDEDLAEGEDERYGR